MRKLGSDFWINFVCCLINLAGFACGPGDAMGMLNLAVAGFCGYWAYKAAQGA